MWLTFLMQLTGELLDAIEYGHLEDLPWRKAELFLDHHVVPRVRKLATTDLTAEKPEPNPHGGFRRVKRMMDGIASKNPDVVRRTLQSWDYARVRFGDVPDPLGWEDWSDAADDHDEARQTA